LKPLFKTFENGQISPIVEPQELKEYKYSQLVEKIKFCQTFSLEQNENYRKEKNLKIKYEYDHFITEGYVLYLLDSEDMLLDRIMYKIKPSDIEEVHWATFDDKMKGLVNEAMLKMKQRNIPFSEDNLKIEMDMQKKEWRKFGSKVMKYIASLNDSEINTNEQGESTSKYEQESSTNESETNEKKRKLTLDEPEEKKKKI
jgi:ribosomal protein L19E